MKILLSLYGRHRQVTHPQALQNLKIIRKELNEFYIFSSKFFYVFLVKAKLLEFLIFICLQLNKLSCLKILIVFSDHQLIKLLVSGEKKYSKNSITNLVINFFYNDWREMEEYKNLSNICYLVGGNKCIIQKNTFKYVPFLPNINNVQKIYKKKKNIIFFAGNVFYSNIEAVTSLESVALSNAGERILSDIINHKCFDDLSRKKNFYLKKIVNLKKEHEILWLWSIYVNIKRSLFFHRLKSSSLKNKVFTIGSRLKNEFKFNGLEDNYTQSLIDEKISQVKVNLDLGSQLLESTFYARSNRIFELSPASIVQYQKADQETIFPERHTEFSFQFFSEFEKIVQIRFQEENKDFDKRDLYFKNKLFNFQNRSITSYDV